MKKPVHLSSRTPFYLQQHDNTRVPKEQPADPFAWRPYEFVFKGSVCFCQNCKRRFRERDLKIDFKYADNHYRGLERCPFCGSNGDVYVFTDLTPAQEALLL